MTQLGLETKIVDPNAYQKTVERFRAKKIRLPTFAQLAHPQTMPDEVRDRLTGVDPDDADPLNLFRVHWYNDAERRTFTEVPGHIVLPPELTGVRAPIVALLGHRFPMITAHKVLAAYGCLAPRMATGQFDPTRHRAVWPSTGNYCRGGVAISRIMDVESTAILPEGMSQERFDWLMKWVRDPEKDILRTVGTESNVKEIYDACNDLEKSPENVIFNQFQEFTNHLVHYRCTGPAAKHVFDHLQKTQPNLRLRAFVSATGSAGTVATGDFLKEEYGSQTASVEALECPTLLYNGFGEHNIQGIGDKHLPFIHNIMNTDFVVGISDYATDALQVMFNQPAGHRYLTERRKLDPEFVAGLPRLGLSSLCNLLAAIKLAKYLNLSEHDAVMTVATDGAELYISEQRKALDKYFGGTFDEIHAAETFGRCMLAAATDHLLELTTVDKHRIFNLGYFTWVEQQGMRIEDFEARRQLSFWKNLRALPDLWDERIRQLNEDAGTN